MGRFSPDHDQRKGQWLVNYLRFKLKVPEENIGRYLFMMDSEEFDQIMKDGNFYQ